MGIARAVKHICGPREEKKDNQMLKNVKKIWIFVNNFLNNTGHHHVHYDII